MEGPLVFPPPDGPVSTQCTLLDMHTSHLTQGEMERSEVSDKIDVNKVQQRGTISSRTKSKGSPRSDNKMRNSAGSQLTVVEYHII